MNIGKAIQKVRVMRSVTQEELGKSVERSEYWLNMMEEGKRIPNLNTLQNIGEVLNVSVFTLIYHGLSDEERLSLPMAFRQELALLADREVGK